MKTATYLATFTSADTAWTHMMQLNRQHPHAEPYVMIDGPDKDYAVVDMSTAIELNAMYRWDV